MERSLKKQNRGVTIRNMILLCSYNKRLKDEKFWKSLVWTNKPEVFRLYPATRAGRGMGRMRWPPHSIPRPMGARGAEGSFTAIMDTAVKKTSLPASYTPRARSTASTAMHFQRKHDVYDHVITKLWCHCTKDKQPTGGSRKRKWAEQTESRFAGKCPSTEEKKKENKRGLTKKIYLV